MYISTCGNKNCSKEIMKQTNRDRYGYDWPTQSPIIMNKIREIFMANYGYWCCLQHPDVWAKALATKELLYGDPNYNNIEKMIQTNLNKWGYKCTLQHPDVWAKALATKRLLYDNENFVNPKKAKDTKRKRYNDENYNNIEKAI